MPDRKQIETFEAVQITARIQHLKYANPSTRLFPNAAEDAIPEFLSAGDPAFSKRFEPRSSRNLFSFQKKLPAKSLGSAGPAILS
jgi:hypothetical protein